MSDTIENYENDRIYRTYYQEVGQHAILTVEEERNLITRYHTCPRCSSPIPQKIDVVNCPTCGSVESTAIGDRVRVCTTCTTKYDKVVIPKQCPACGSSRDIEARDRLAVTNLRFVVKRAAQLSKNRPHMLHTLISAGNIGLLLAIERFSADRNTRFLTYADWWIRKEMYDTINASTLVHIPTHKQKALLREQSTGKYVCSNCGCRADNFYGRADIPDCVESAHDFQLVHRDLLGLLGSPVSLDEYNAEEDSTLDESVTQTEVSNALREILNTLDLSERDKFILLGYFNIPNKDRHSEPKNLHQLSEMTGITPERVRQIKESLLRQLRKTLKKGSIESFRSLGLD